ncbi:hypothetical protein QJS10_CPB18g00649 [Acorus calamus]|uniref:Uncharacterized protein n=1 Tax=Acorus calamus TaxID=4465 RepID=A0AAV9CRD4_ACOCL|nr:hypothetical protein QJS10_CPB18g00649 [Acorus calamus]
MSFKTSQGPKRHVRFEEVGSGGGSRHAVVDNVEEDYTAYQARPDGRHFLNHHMMFGNRLAAYNKDTEIRVHEEERVFGGDGRVVSKTVDTVYEGEGIDSAAAEYIRRRHHSLELQKLMSMRNA